MEIDELYNFLEILGFKMYNGQDEINYQLTIKNSSEKISYKVTYFLGIVEFLTIVENNRGIPLRTTPLISHKNILIHLDDLNKEEILEIFNLDNIYTKKKFELL